MESVPKNPYKAPSGWVCRPEVIREFVRRCRWNWAKTYLDVPHEYIVRGRCELSEQEFHTFFEHQRYGGEMEWYGKVAKPYFYLDGYKYWTMGDPWETTIIMNRQRVFDEIDRIGALPESYYSESDARTVAKIISDQKPLSMFEFGVGDGKWLEFASVQPGSYRCCDPSRLVADSFKIKNPLYASRFSRKTFEESVKKWSSFTFVCGLFGSASYIMWQYLQMFSEQRIPYMLMFFRFNERPAELQEYHCFNYSDNQLKRLFPRGIFSEWKDYRIVSSFPIDWKLNESFAREASIYSPTLF